MEEAVGIISIVAAVAVALGVLGGVAYLAMRSRDGASHSVSLRLPLRVYLHAGVLAGLVLITVGVAGLVRAGLGYGLGKDFSYYPMYLPPPPPRAAEPAAPPQAGVPQPPPAAGIPPPGVAPAPPGFVSPVSPEEQRQQREKGLDRAAQEGLLNGLSYAVVGVVLWGVHVAARRRLETREERDGPLERGYLVLMAAIFGVIVLVNLPQAIFGLLRFYVLEPLGEAVRPRPPGNNIAFALAALPVWVAYLLGAIRAMRGDRGGVR